MSDSPIKLKKCWRKLNRLRTDLDKDPTDPEWFALHGHSALSRTKLAESGRDRQAWCPGGLRHERRTRPQKWKDTLHLPKTDFAMRTGLATNELNSVRSGPRSTSLKSCVKPVRPRSRLCSTMAPFANGNLPGHLLNKVLKDFVVRSRLMQGRK